MARLRQSEQWRHVALVMGLIGGWFGIEPLLVGGICFAARAMVLRRRGV